MKITYAGQLIASEPSEGGLDGVEDFVPGDGEQLSEWDTPVRGEDAYPMDFGNRQRTITGKVVLGSQADLATAMVLRGTFYDGLPPRGNLILYIGVKMITFQDSMLKSCKVLRNQLGISVGFQFTFFPSGPGVVTVNSEYEILNKNGAPILNKDGTPIVNKT